MDMSLVGHNLQRCFPTHPVDPNKIFLKDKNKTKKESLMYLGSRGDERLGMASCPTRSGSAYTAG